MNTSLDRFYDYFGNVVLRDSNGNPGIFVKHPKVNSSFFDPLLPDTPHPAFVIGEDVDDAVLIGKYINSALTESGVLYSLPNAEIKQTNISVENAKSRIGMFNQYSTHMTIADHGLFVLMGHKYGDAGMRGAQSQCCDSKDVQGVWKTPYTATSSDVGKIFSFQGYAYKLLGTHTFSNSLKPDVAPQYWEKIKKIGATINRDYVDPDGSIWRPSYLTGSGPASFYMLQDPSLEADIIGDPSIYISGFRIYKSEIQIIPYNKAALPTTDISDTSTEWRAILPHENDSGCEYVAPNTEGTLHLAYINNKITIVGRVPESSELNNVSARTTKFKDIVVETTTVPIMPTIMYELGLCPIPGTNVSGDWYELRIGDNVIEHFSAFGNPSHGNANKDGNGLGAMTDFMSYTSDRCASRTRVRVTAE